MLWPQHDLLALYPCAAFGFVAASIAIEIAPKSSPDPTTVKFFFISGQLVATRAGRRGAKKRVGQ
jgi:hypothetical protein